jgi:hypothetical protein
VERRAFSSGQAERKLDRQTKNDTRQKMPDTYEIIHL